ncbi:hypothetical protein FDN13_12285 [Caloramator sp. E03]|uniref:HutD family protein n=1 Tax=Caloramator sp. E03 TaxID=2576307 RepID=UPI0011104717|nr:HutD family protein [Caloramator sp. E03]QCX34412.1 hypothetical protein FDN13_12285 [Caloramator sp. E03]
MGFEVKIIKRENQITAKSNGGITKEIYIYPESSKYSNRDFVWSLSIFTLEEEEFIFEDLPNYERYIMPINGQLKLEHKGYYRTKLMPFESDWSLGEWITYGKGKSVNFSLVLAKGLKGCIDSLKIKDGIYVDDMIWNGDKEFKREAKALYCCNEGFSVEFNNYQYSLNAGEMLLIIGDSVKGKEQIKLFSSCDEVMIVKAEVLFN